MEIFSPLHPRRIIRLKQYITGLSGLVGYWPLWENDGAVAVNHAPDNLRTLNGITTGATVAQSGQVGKAYSFDGSDDNVNLGTSSSLDLGTTFTVLLTINPAVLTGAPVILGRIDDLGEYSTYWYFAPTGEPHKIQVSAGDGANFPTINSSSTISNGNWFQLAWTRSTDDHELFINGSTEGTVSQAINDINASSNNVYIGGDFESDPGDFRFNGLIQHVAIFDKALTAKQILKLAQIAGLA
ncbi:hypothetical protein LCGC14_2616970 [marine sediment metagenome]|uniref:LamG-like jellyroll fold domain-containing protein n=1 Tax=marine sediment metagenome TaxID=412755 RepID=A0A0F9ARU3_9ZZZZ